MNNPNISWAAWSINDQWACNMIDGSTITGRESYLYMHYKEDTDCFIISLCPHIYTTCACVHMHTCPFWREIRLIIGMCMMWGRDFLTQAIIYGRWYIIVVHVHVVGLPLSWSLWVLQWIPQHPRFCSTWQSMHGIFVIIAYHWLSHEKIRAGSVCR